MGLYMSSHYSVLGHTSGSVCDIRRMGLLWKPLLMFLLADSGLKWTGLIKNTRHFIPCAIQAVDPMILFIKNIPLTIKPS